MRRGIGFRRQFGASRQLFRALLFGSLGAASLLGSSAVPSAAQSRGLGVQQVDHISPVGVVNLVQLATAPAGPARGVQHLTIGRHGVQSSNTAPRAALAQALGGDGSPASSVVMGGDNGNFNGISNLDMEGGGTGLYANTQPTLEPPDQGLCTGAGFVMEAVNDALRVYTTGGVAQTPLSVPLAQFFLRAPNGPTQTDFISDPRCLFDHDTQRWFVTILDLTEPTIGQFTDDNNFIAVSQTSNPTGSWTIYKFDVFDNGTNGSPAHAGCTPGTSSLAPGCLGDQPTIGTDANGIYITDNEYAMAEVFPAAPPVSPPLQQIPVLRSGVAQLYALSKQQLVSGTMTTLVRFDTGDPLTGVPFPSTAPTGDGPWQSISPAQPVAGDTTPATPGGVEYFLSDVGLPVGHNANQVVVWAWTNTASLTTATPTLALQHVVINTASASDTFFVPDPSPPANQGPFYAYQKVGPAGCCPVTSNAGDPQEVLNANDDRIGWVTLSNGSLWTGLNTQLSPTNASGSNPHATNNRVGIMYFQVTPSIVGGTLQATTTRDGYVQVLDNNVLFPSIGPRVDGATVVTFTLAGSDYFPSLAWARLDGLITGQAPVVHVARLGAAPEDGFTGVGPVGQQGGIDQPPCGPCVARWGDYSATQVDENGCIWGAAEYIPTGQHEAPIQIGPVSLTFTDWGTGIYNVCPAAVIGPGIPETPFVPAMVILGLGGIAALAGVRRLSLRRGRPDSGDA
jgi:hypothetical protein